MNLAKLGSSPLGDLLPISGTDVRTGHEWSHFAYAAHPLPSQPILSLAAVNLSAQAAMAVARLDQAVSQLPNPQILVRPILRREAASTSALEGTYASFDEVLVADFLEDQQLSSEQREIRNYVQATELAVTLLETYPISRKIAGLIQQTIVRGTDGDSYDAGDLRKRQVAIGPKNRPIHEARFVPCPPGALLVEGFSEWERWVNAENHVPIVAKMAMAHYQFETLHPFADGNGRLGRLIAILQLMQEGILRWPVLNLAPWLEAHRNEYQDGLLLLSETGDFDAWICFFAEAVRVQAVEGVIKIAALLTLKDTMIEELRKQGVRGSALEIAANLIGYPIIDVPTAKLMVNRTFEAANSAVSRLVTLGILREITGKRHNRLFICDRAFRMIQNPA